MADRFWSKVKKTRGCWIWTAAVVLNGLPYGRFGIGSRSDFTRRTVLAHRYSWELHYGPIPEGLCVLHRCDNPPCVRPIHLFLGSNQDNSDDALQKGRTARGGDIGKLSDSKVLDIRKLVANSDLTQGQIAKIFGITHQLVSQIHLRRVWRHL